MEQEANKQGKGLLSKGPFNKSFMDSKVKTRTVFAKKKFSDT